MGTLDDCLHCEYCDEDCSSIQMTHCPDCKAVFCSEYCLTRHYEDIDAFGHRQTRGAMPNV